MSTTSSSPITPNLPEFPFSPASDARRQLGSLYSSSHFVTTVVNPPTLGPAPPQRLRPSGSRPLDRQESTDPSHPPLPLSDLSSAEISTLPSEKLEPPACPSIPSETAQLNGPASADSCPFGIKPDRVKSSNPRPTPLSSKAHSFVQAPVLIGTGKGRVAWPSPRNRSAWQRFKRMGNRLGTPLRSMGICLTACTGGRRVMTLCEDFSDHDASPGSSWYSSGEYPPEFVRDVLENNVLVGELTV